MAVRTTAAQKALVGQLAKAGEMHARMLMDHDDKLTALGTTDASGYVKMVSASISLAEMQALAGGVKTISKNVGAVLPANARLLAVNYTLVLIDNAGDTSATTAKCGGTDDDGLLAFADVTTGSGTALHGNGNGAVLVGDSLSAQQLVLNVTSDTDLKDMTKGSLAVVVLFTVPAV
jgi:hypothetical protein